MYKRGIFKQFQTVLKRRRVGELLLANGLITSSELRKAMRTQKETQTPLGQIFLEQAVISKNQLRFILFKQTALRTCAAIMLFAMSLGVNERKARAEILPDVSSSIQMVSMSPEFARVSAYPKIYGTKEKRSSNLKAFTKWTGMFKKFERQLRQESSAKIVRDWQKNLRDIRGSSIKSMANQVNNLVNKKRYIVDSKNWGTSDYWATPVEFLERGGDCEDFAIMKYTALRSMGIPEERLRIAIVQDLKKNIPHAVLIVYAEDGAYILDNQIKRMISAESGTRYKPIYSINRTAWWLHTAPSNTIVASAQ